MVDCQIMELRVLRYFLAVAREHSITRAATALHITQPTLSRQIAELEEELSTPLFQRDNNRLQLTEAGLRFVQRAEEIISLTDRTVKEFSSKQTDISGEVYLGCAESSGMQIIADVARKLHKRFPGVRLSMQTAHATTIAEQLESGLIDFGFILEPVDIVRFDSQRLPHRDVWGILLHRDHPLAGQAAVTPEQVAAQPLLIPYRPPVISFLSGWLGKDLNTCDIRARYNLIYNATLFVKSGQGCAITLEDLVSTVPDSPFRFVPFSPQLTSQAYLIWKKVRFFNPAAQVFYLTLYQHVRKLEAALDSPGNMG